MIVLKLRAARNRARAKHRKCEGRKPYGTLPGEREVIEKMFETYDKGAGYTAVYKDLNKLGIKSRTGKPWTKAVVTRIMKRTPERLHRATAIEAR